MEPCEAIKIINQYDMNFYWNDGKPIPAERIAEAFDIAISALKQREKMQLSRKDATFDLIDRREAIDAVKKNTFRLTMTEKQNGKDYVAWSANAVYSDAMEGALLDLPCAQPEVTADDYKRGYEQGLTDAWETARKIAVNMNVKERAKVFFPNAEQVTHEEPFKSYTASEAIAKIAEHEKQKEEINVGDEVKTTYGRAVVFYIQGDRARYIYKDGGYDTDYLANLQKTGRHFHEIAEVLRKMKEGADGC